MKTDALIELLCDHGWKLKTQFGTHCTYEKANTELYIVSFGTLARVTLYQDGGQKIETGFVSTHSVYPDCLSLGVEGLCTVTL